MKLRPGDVIDRAEFHVGMGGRPHGHRVSPSVQTNNVFLFLDPAKEESAGAICGLAKDGTFHMVGEGGTGDQNQMRGNKVILTHAEAGRPLHLFMRMHTGQFRYAGQFELDRDRPFYRVDLPEEKEELVVRDVYVFRLRPVGEHLPLPPSTLARPMGDFHPREAMLSVLAVKGWREKTSLEKSAESLLTDFYHHLSAEGHQVVTVRIPAGDGTECVGVPLLDRTTDTVVLSPGSASRSAVRTAVGEAMDLKRLTGAEYALVVLPSEPREDILSLIEYAGLEAAWPAGREWLRSVGPERKPGLR